MSISKTAEVIPFNPLDKRNLGASVAEALVSQPAHALGALKSFFGSGIYAIYYTAHIPLMALSPRQTERS